MKEVLDFYRKVRELDSPECVAAYDDPASYAQLHPSKVATVRINQFLRSFRIVYLFPRYDTSSKIFRFSRYTLGLEFLRKIKAFRAGYADCFFDSDRFLLWFDKLPPNFLGELMVHPKYAEGDVIVDCNMPMSEINAVVLANNIREGCYV